MAFNDDLNIGAVPQQAQATSPSSVSSGFKDDLGIAAPKESETRSTDSSGISLAEANEIIRQNEQALKRIDLWGNVSSMLTRSKAEDEIKLAEDVITRGRFDADSRRVIRQRAKERADAIINEGRLLDPNKPEASWAETLSSIWPRTKARGGQIMGGAVRGVGEFIGSKPMAESGEAAFKGAKLAEEEATPNVPAGSAKGYVANAGVSFLQQMPSFLMGLASGQPWIPLASIYATTGAQQFGEKRSENMGFWPSMLSAHGTASSEWVTEFLPMGSAIRIFRGPVGKMLMEGKRWAKTELSGEVLNTVTQSMQSFAEKYPQKSLKEWTDTLPAEIRDTVIETVIQGAGFMGFSIPTAKARKVSYLHSVSKDISTRTGLSIDDVRPIVNEAFATTKDDTTGKTFTTTVNEKVNALVKEKMTEIENAPALTEEAKQSMTDMLNDPSNPTSIIDIQKEIVKNREDNPKLATELQAFLNEYRSGMSADDLNKLTIESESAKLDAGPLAAGWLQETGDKSHVVKDLDAADKVQRIWEQFFPENEAKGAPRSYADRVETDREGREEPTYTAQGKLIKPEVPGIPQRTDAIIQPGEEGLTSTQPQTTLEDVQPPSPEKTPSTLPVDETLKGDEGKSIAEAEKKQQGEKEPWEMTSEDYVKTLPLDTRFVPPQPGRMGTRVIRLSEDKVIITSEHGKAVWEALREGKPVPSSVLAEYPDLKEKFSATKQEGATGQSKPTEPEKQETPPVAPKEKEGKQETAVSEETEYPYYKYFTRYPKFLPLLNKIRKGMDLNQDPSFISFTQKFNEDMDVGNIPHKLSPSGTTEWREDEVQTLIQDEMNRRKAGGAIAPVSITLTDEELQKEGFIEEKEVDEVIKSATINIQGIKEELYEEGYSDEESAAIVRGIEASSADTLNSKALEETLASLKEQVRQARETSEDFAEINFDFIIDAQAQWGTAIGEIGEKWRESYNHAQEVEERYNGQIEPIEKQMELLKGKTDKESKAKRKELKENIDSLKAKATGLYGIYETAFTNETEKVLEEALQRLNKLGIPETNEEYDLREEFWDSFSDSINPESRSIEHTYKKTVNELFIEDVEYLIEQHSDESWVEEAKQKLENYKKEKTDEPATTRKEEDKATLPEKVTDQLFNTSSMFTLSGNQPTITKTFKPSERKGERLFDVKKQSTEELQERLSGEKAKKEYEGEKAKEITYEEFAKLYRDTFKQSQKYTPKQAGFNTYTDAMAKLADNYPEYLERFEREEEEKTTEKKTQGKKVEEAGEELTYNKRNSYIKGKTWEDIKGLNDTLKKKETVKQNIWPKQDYEQMVANGKHPLVAHLFKQVYDSVAASPVVRGTPTDEHFKLYIKAIERVRNGLEKWIDNPEALAKWAEKQASIAGAMLGKVTNLTDLARNSETLYEIVYPGGWKNFRDEATILGGNKIIGALQPGYEEGKRAIKAVENGWPGKREAWQIQGYQIVMGDELSSDYYEQTKGNEYVSAWISVKSGGRSLGIENKTFEGVSSRNAPVVKEWVNGRLAALKGKQLLLSKNHKLKGIFDTVAAAQEKARELVKKEGKTTIKDEGISVAAARREGIARRMEGEDITADRLIKEFGFRGVNFGNWMPDNERQLHLNHAFDSFHDLADILGVPPQAMSLNGILGIAFGAQGTGQYAAHFVPGVNEINLTRTAGAGSLSHEFGHALDHYFATQAGLATSEAPYLSEHSDSRKIGEGIRPEIVSIFKSIVTAMNKRPQTEEELKARRKEVQERGVKQLERWLNSLRGDFTGIENEFDKLADRVKNGDYGDGKVAISPTASVYPVLIEMRELFKKNKGRLYSLDNIKAVNSWIDSVEYAKKNQDAEITHIPQVDTEYATNAYKLDKEKGGKRYWSTNAEKFARAFDAYVSDTVEKKAIENTYLSHTGREGDTVPQGKEREKISDAFQTLVDTIETKPTDKGRAMFKIAPLYHGTPYIFDRFSTEKIGTGEGAQAFGWGLYFTDQRSVARYYANHISSGGKITYDGREIDREEFIKTIHEQYKNEEYDLIHDLAVLTWSDFVNGYSYADTIYKASKKGLRAQEITEEITKGMEGLHSDTRVSVYPRAGIRVINSMSNDDRSLFYDLTGRASWYKNAEVAGREVLAQLEATVDAQQTWEKNSRDRGSLEEAEEARKIGSNAKRMLEMIKEFDLQFRPPSQKRNIYKVSLHEGKDPSEYDYLDWDRKPTEKQEQKIRHTILARYSKDNPLRQELLNAFDDEYAQIKKWGEARYWERGEYKTIYANGYGYIEKVDDGYYFGKMRGGTPEFAGFAKTKEVALEQAERYTPKPVPIESNSQLYRGISDVLGSDKQASLFLLDAGIDGIKYPAGSLSGAQGEGFNYVVFDENAVTIEEVERYKLATPETLANYSFGDIRPPKEPRFSVDQVKQFLAGPLHRWPNVGEVRVVKTAGELPVRFMGAVVEGDTVMGAYDDETDTIYIIADAIGSARAAIVTLVHEAVGHRGIHAVLGRSEEKVVMAQIARAYENSPMLQKIAKDYGFDMNRDDAAQSIFKKPWIELSDSEQRRTEEEVQKNRRAAAGELIAHMAESREQPGLFKRIIGMIRAALRRGFPSLRWTDTDILHLIERSRRFSGVAPKGKTGVYFKKSSEENQPSTSTPKPRTLQEILAEAKTQPTIFDDRMAKESEPPPHDAPPDDIKTWMRRETGAIFSHLTRTIGTESDFGKFFEKMLKSPEWWTNPTLKRIVHYFADTRSEAYHENVYHLTNIDGRNIVKETEAMKKKDPEKYKQLTWAIDYGDTVYKRGKESMARLRDPSISREARLAIVANQVKKYEEFLRSKGLPEDVIDLWMLHRTSYDRALDLMTEQMREMIAELEEQQKAMLPGTMDNAKAELLKTLRGYLANMEEWRGFYAPRLREPGNWTLQLQKGQDKVRFHGSSWKMERLWKQLEADGWKPIGPIEEGKSPVQKIKRLPEEVYQNLKTVDVAKAISYAMERSKDTAEVTAAFNDEVLELVSDMMKARGFRSTMIHRMEGKVIKGYEEDPFIRYIRYANNISSGLAKAKVARLAYEEVLGTKNEKGEREGGLSPVDDKQEYLFAQRYIAFQLQNLDHVDRLIGLAKSMATFKFLGINPRSILVNLTALGTTAPAAVHQWAGEKSVSMAKVLKEISKASKDASLMIAGKEVNLPDREKAYIEKISKEGWDDPQYSRDAMGAMQKTHMRFWNKMMDISMFGFMKSEQLNRKATLLAAFRIAYAQGIKEGMTEEEAIERAEQRAKKASDKAHGIYGKATLPMIAQLPYIGKIAQLMYVYGKFGHNYVQMLWDLGMNQHNFKALAWGLLSPIVLAGGTVLPFKDILWAMLGGVLKMFGIGGDPEKGFWDWIRKQFGKQGEMLGRYGLAGGLGVDISGSLAVGIDMPRSWKDLLGAPAGVVEDMFKASHFLATGRQGRAIEKALPTGLANVARSFRERREGATTERGFRVYTDEGKPYVPSLGEMALRMGGFRSSREATLASRTQEAKREKADFEEKKSAIYEEYRGYLANPNHTKKEHDIIVKKVVEFNKKLREEGIDEVPRITFEQMRTQVKRMQKPTRAQRRLYAN